MTGLTGFHCNLKLGCCRKNPHPPTDGIVEILVGGGGGVKDSGNPGRRGGGFKLKKSSAGVILTDSSRDLNV